MTSERLAPSVGPGGSGWAGGQRWVRIRVVGVAVLFVALFGLLVRKAYLLQVTQQPLFENLAHQQYLRDIELPAHRGKILDRSGAELAVSVEDDSIYANPRQVQAAPGGTQTVARALAPILKADREDLAKRLQPYRFFAWLKRQVTPDEARAVRDLKLPGVYLTREPHRYYPNRSLAGTVLGWAGVDGKGLEGLELFFDRELRGTKAEVQGLRDARGREVFPTGAGDTSETGGHEVVTTLDRFLQYRLEQALEAGVAHSHAKGASAVAMDPKSGEVLAMASWPPLDPNTPSAESGKGARNKPVTDPFEPGSTMKTFSITAAVEAGLVQPDERWFCENGRYPVGAAVIHDAEPIGNVSTTEVLARSSNICTAKIARRSGKERVSSMLHRFGFGAATGVDLPGERAGLLRSVKQWGEIELATISFGQGVTATPLQILAGYSAIANGGTLYRPHVLAKILDENGKVLSETAPQGHRVISPEVARTMRGMLKAVLEKGGTGESLVIPGYPAAGKTGTAQKVDPLTRRYSTEKWASSFVGFAPLDDPRLAIFVMIDEPTGTHFGSAVAGPVWREVMADGLRHMNVPPVEGYGDNLLARAGKNAKASPAATMTAAAPVAALAREGAPSSSEGAEGASAGTNASANSNAAAAGSSTDEATYTVGYLGGSDEVEGGREVPDFSGMSVGEALEAARRTRLPVEILGSGRAIAQEPRPGRNKGTARCRIRFAPPST